MAGLAHYFHVRPFEVDLLEVVHFLALCDEVDEIRAENEAARERAKVDQQNRRHGGHER